MLLAETGIFYLVLGAGIAGAVLLRSGGEGRIARLGEACLALLFWPLMVPLLLSERARPQEAAAPAEPAIDELSQVIARVECELDEALGGMAGWAEEVLASEQPRLTELRTAWQHQAERIRELDKLLASPAACDAFEPLTYDHSRARRCEQQRQQNLEQLRELRGQLHSDLLGTLAWVRELVTMIHLARFGGAPAGRIEELVAQIAATVEGLSEVSHWRETSQANC
jgi:hypothetical protein